MKFSFFSKKITMLYLFFLFFIHASADTTLSGILVKKYYKTPSIVQNPAFGWFLEIDEDSRSILKEELSKFGTVDKELCCTFPTDMIQLMLNHEVNKETCRELENQYVKVKGNLFNPPLIIRPIPAYQFSFYNIELMSDINYFAESKIIHPESIIVKEESSQSALLNSENYSDIPLEHPPDKPLSVITLQGVLRLKLYPGSPNYISIESGDCPEYCWMIEMNPQSFDIASQTLVYEPALTMADIMSSPDKYNVQLISNENRTHYYENHVNQQISIQGYLSHAIFAHHHAPFLLEVVNTN